MKNIKTFCITAALALVTSACAAYEATTFPVSLQGTWENMAGEKLNVTETAVDQYKLVGIEQSIGGSENGAMLIDMNIDGAVKKSTIGYKLRPDYAVLAVNHQPYYKFSKAHYESIDGIYLGMTARELESIYGQPDLIDGNPGYNCWHYNKKGIAVNFYYELISDISMSKKSGLKLERSGLGGKAPWDAYSTAYKDTANWSERVALSKEQKVPLLVVASARHSEYIWIDENEIRLSSTAY